MKQKCWFLVHLVEKRANSLHMIPRLWLLHIIILDHDLTWERLYQQQKQHSCSLRSHERSHNAAKNDVKTK
jgi:hypothetical protein